MSTSSQRLTDEQLAIIEAPVAHVAITAVAGSGKTTTLAHRIIHLLKQGLDHRRLLVLMFNRAAKIEFEVKLRGLATASGQTLPEVRTYHAMGLRLYRRFVAEGYLDAFDDSILSEGEIQFQLWQLIRQRAPADMKGTLNRDKKELIEKAAAILEIAKAQLSDLTLVFEQLGIQPKFSFLLEVAESFESWRKTQRRISFADMLHEPVKALQKHAQLREIVQNKMDVILVDEYQDTNEVQHQLLRFIAGNRARVTIVGDPDQTIYEFRGASTDFILKRFGEDFEGPERFDLTWSFRYGHRTALAANHLIGHNLQRRDILCRSHGCTPATRVELLSATDEAQTISSLLQSLAPQPAAAGEITPVAILCRLWSQAVPIELGLLAHGLSYRIEASKGALNNREVKQTLNLLRACAANWSSLRATQRSEILLDLLRFPHVAIRDDVLRGIARSLAEIDPTAPEQLEHIGLSKTQCKERYGISSWQLSRIKDTLTALRSATLASGSASEVLALYMAQTDLLKQLGASALTTDAADEKINNVRGLYYYIKMLNLPVMDTLAHFDELSQRASGDHDEAFGSGTDSMRASAIVELTTIHKTKGLEWPTVIVAGLRDGILPYKSEQRGGKGDADAVQSDLEAERRLAYVAVTRARDRLYLSVPADDSGAGGISRFIAEMNLETCREVAAVLEGSETESNSLPASSVASRYLAHLTGTDD